MQLYDDPQEEQKLWEVRESGLGATAFVPGQRDNWPGWEDSAVPPERIGDYLRDLKKLFARHDYDASVYGHFGQGLVHCRIPFDLVTHTGIEKYRDFLDDAADLVVSYGGSLSGEHGDGQARAALLPKMYGEELVQAFREFKAIWDPHGKMNPGKVVDPNPPTANSVSARITIRASRKPISSFPTTRAALRARRYVAWVSANAGAIPAARCVPATW